MPSSVESRVGALRPGRRRAVSSAASASGAWAETRIQPGRPKEAASRTASPCARSRAGRAAAGRRAQRKGVTLGVGASPSSAKASRRAEVQARKVGPGLDEPGLGGRDRTSIPARRRHGRPAARTAPPACRRRAPGWHRPVRSGGGDGVGAAHAGQAQGLVRAVQLEHGVASPRRPGRLAGEPQGRVGQIEHGRPGAGVLRRGAVLAQRTARFGVPAQGRAGVGDVRRCRGRRPGLPPRSRRTRGAGWRRGRGPGAGRPRSRAG